MKKLNFGFLLLILFLFCSESQKERDRNTALWYYATIKVNADKVDSLITAGANVNYGSSLSDACAIGYFEVVKVLIENGADINAPRSRWDCTPLMGAVLNNHVEIAVFLLEQENMSIKLIKKVKKFLEDESCLYKGTNTPEEEKWCSLAERLLPVMEEKLTLSN